LSTKRSPIPKNLASNLQRGCAARKIFTKSRYFLPKTIEKKVGAYYNLFVKHSNVGYSPLEWSAARHFLPTFI
jgi:hypothetical protein